MRPHHRQIVVHNLRFASDGGGAPPVERKNLPFGIGSRHRNGWVVGLHDYFQKRKSNAFRAVWTLRQGSSPKTIGRSPKVIRDALSHASLGGGTIVARAPSPEPAA